MSLRRLRALTDPRRAAADREAMQQAHLPRRDAGDAVLARWMAHAERAHSTQSPHDLWAIYNSPVFADLWYAAREAGERLRARAVAHLYAHRALPGGPYPDPRESATFSERAILVTAAQLEGLSIHTYPHAAATATDPAEQPPLAWLVTYPAATPGATPGAPSQATQATQASQASQAQLWTMPPNGDASQGAILFALACLIGYVTKERHLLDPNAPHGVTTLPDEPTIEALMHQFAIALLHFDPRCPSEWGCHCNIIHRRFTAPPADHDQPTETLTMADLARQARPDTRIPHS